MTTPPALGRYLVAALLAATPAACSQNPDGGVGSFGSGAEGGGDTSGDTGHATTDASTDATTSDGDTGPFTSAGSTSDDPSTSGALSDTGGSSGGESTTQGGSTGGEPVGGPYAPCVTNTDCGPDPGLACLKADQNGADGFCSPSCGTMSVNPPDPSLCPDAPVGVTATVVCLEGLIRSCALDCSGGATCPSGTECLPANNGYGPFCFGS